MAAGDASQRVRIVAARGLGNTGQPDAAAVLLGLLPEDLVPEGIVASALLELGPEGAPVLRKALREDEPGHGPERAMAADVLGLLDEMTAWEELAACLDDSVLAVRISAARALGRLGMPRSAPGVIRCLAPGADPDLRAVAARALGRIGDERAVPVLAGCLTAPGYWVAHNSAEALAVLGEPGREALAEAARSGGPAVPYAKEALTLARLVGARREPRLPGGREP
jgi:HEAT repeat protein